MKKFLALYRMDAAEMQKMMANATPEQRKKGMAEWETWMKKKSASFADRGGPAGKTKKVAAGGVTDTRNDIGGYSSCRPARTTRPQLFLPTARIS